jgi:phosphoribosyl 1,2-cyclic phosphodiesterase
MADANPIGEEPLYNILVDCGKSFRESAIKVFAPLGVSFIHSLLLTHPHADAILGLDDLREFSIPSRPTPVYLDAETEVQVRKTFGYLFPTEEAKHKKLWVASVDWRPMFEGAPMRPKGGLLHGVLDVTFPTSTKALPTCRKRGDAGATSPPAASLPLSSSWPISVFQVWHGVDTVSNAFVFPLPCPSDTDDCKVIVYLSDISVVKDDTLATIRRYIELLHEHIRQANTAQGEMEQTATAAASETPVSDVTPRDDEAFLARYVEVAIVDMLSEEPYISHLNTKEAVAAAKRIGAAHTYFVGMSHSLFYDDMPQRIKELGGDPNRMELAWDGCIVYGAGPSSIAVAATVNEDGCD